MIHCYPEQAKRPACLPCARYKPDQPLHTGIRQFPVIDATKIAWPATGCPMFAEREVAQHWSEK